MGSLCASSRSILCLVSYHYFCSFPPFGYPTARHNNKRQSSAVTKRAERLQAWPVSALAEWIALGGTHRYREERRRHYPSADNLARRQAERADRLARGEPEPEASGRVLRLQEVTTHSSLLTSDHATAYAFRQVSQHSSPPPAGAKGTVSGRSRGMASISCRQLPLNGAHLGPFLSMV